MICAMPGEWTVTGKGGRPRKWRSDADRARAYRARKRGLPEPPPLADESDDGDQLVVAWRHIDDLGQLVAEIRQRERSLRAEVRQLCGELDAERQRMSDLERAHRELLAALVEARTANELQRRRLIELTEAYDDVVHRPDSAATGDVPSHGRLVGGNRALRRRAERERRRRA